MQLEDRHLELDESELFGDEEDSPSQLKASASMGTLSPPATVHAPQLITGESESDDDGIVLESECSSSDDELAGDLAIRIESLQSSMDAAAPVHEQELGTSESSQVGSLKGFPGTSFNGKRLFGSEGDLAVSMPVRGTAPMLAMRRRVAPVVEKQACNLGTSMPISIPMMHVRTAAINLQTAPSGAAPGTFVPPHMLQLQETDLGGLVSAPGANLSPTAAAKREKLLARNAILRSTGFIEVQRPMVMGEVLDPVKDQLMGNVGQLGAMASAPAGTLPIPGALGEAPRSTPRSGLSQLLGSSK